MRLVAYLMVFIGCGAIGYLMDIRNKERIKELQHIVMALEQLKGEINYRLTPFPEACFFVGQVARGDVRKLFADFGEMLQRGEETDTLMMWQQVLEAEKYRYHLVEEDYKVLELFGQLPSYSDKDIQKNHIELVMAKMRKMLERSEEEQLNKGSLYTKMGTLIGACICILLM